MFPIIEVACGCCACGCTSGSDVSEPVGVAVSVDDITCFYFVSKKKAASFWSLPIISRKNKKFEYNDDKHWYV
jgi:hypothetical protein